MTYALLIIASILGLLLFSKLFLSPSKDPKNKSDSPTVFKDLQELGYSLQKTSYCTKFVHQSASETVEIEFSSPKRNVFKVDIDRYSNGFNLQVPNNVSPGFFEHIVFRNYNKKCLDEFQIELLPNVASGGYFTRTSQQLATENSYTVAALQDTLISHRYLVDNFEFIVAEDLDHAFFKHLEMEGYAHQLATQNMLVRYSKFIDNCHASVYYIKALKMLFLTVSPKTDTALQEDFKDSYTQLHHFNDNKQEATKNTLVYPSSDTFKQLEFELIEALNIQLNEEE